VNQVAPPEYEYTRDEQRIVLIRHAATSWSRTGRHTGGPTSRSTRMVSATQKPAKAPCGVESDAGPR